ncbi:proton-conducting transporter transmembrane domain-containing protein [Desulfolutivibrio sulfoxidireducens]|uniref:proton-conducting transporter transmembrane domain-containing protein n=1 Tax=Desulfolutivibrio sulfoxidireducens TaxID=2773299 RepID=UPI001FE950A5|nr:proton-conducting transporter membrane subunit [Desulfolutivibrio sulfoxidireducens]
MDTTAIATAILPTIGSVAPLLAVCAPLAAVPGIILAGERSPNRREAWTFLAAVTAFLLVVAMLPAVLSGIRVQYVVAEVLPGAALAFSVDGPGLLFALVASFLWIVTSMYSVGYMRGLSEHAQTRYFAFFAVSVSAALGVALSANLFTLYLFYEILSFATYPLVTHHQDAEAVASGRTYLAYIVGGSIALVLPAMIAVAVLSGTLAFTPGGVLPPDLGAPVVGLLLVAFAFGFAKAALMPMHAWLPAAMVAPTPVSALLHAVAVVKVGVFSVYRVVTGILGTGFLSSLHLGDVLVWAAVVTMIAASLLALTQDGLKKRLAYSTVGQLAYVVLGAALLCPRGNMGGLLHIAMHACGKITLFFCAGAILVATGEKCVSRLGGLGRRMPLTFTAFFVGALSIIGVPPTAGFVSKWQILLGAAETGRYAVVAALCVSSLLSAAYFLPVVFAAFFGQPPKDAAWAGAQKKPGQKTATTAGVREAPLWCVIPPLVTAACVLALFWWPDVLARLAGLGE